MVTTECLLFIHRVLSSSLPLFAIAQMKKLSLRKFQLLAQESKWQCRIPVQNSLIPKAPFFPHHPKIINAVIHWNYHKFCHYFVLGSTKAHWLKHMSVLWQASTFCVPGYILGLENLETVSLYRLASQSVSMFECQLCVRC